MPNYFLVSLANRENLALCIKYALAGFTNSGNGFWTYLEIEQHDFISFLYGAKVWNLYRVTEKVALEDAQRLPPWPAVTFKKSGKTYYFPFRLHLEPVRALQESLVRREFAYVAENLLLRGGYGKTHFQADQTTLQEVSQLGYLYDESVEILPENAKPFKPLITFTKPNSNPPMIYQFSELILQALVKNYLRMGQNLRNLLSDIALDNQLSGRMEVLGERALPEGHVDILVKEATPMGTSSKVAIEVKVGTATTTHIDQLEQYVQAMGSECKTGILIARGASPKTISYAKERGLFVLLYRIDNHTGEATHSFQELSLSFQLERC